VNCNSTFHWNFNLLICSDTSCTQKGQSQCGMLRRQATTNARWRLQTVASIWIHIPARRRSSSHGHTACHTHDWLRANCTDFITKDEWAPNSPDLNPLDYHVWGAMLQTFHKLHSKPKTIPELKKVHCSRSVMTCRRQRSTKLLTTFTNVWTHAPRPVVDILNTRYELTLYRNIYTETSVCCFRSCNKLCVITRSLASNSKSSFQITLHLFDNKGPTGLWHAAIVL